MKAIYLLLTVVVSLEYSASQFLPANPCPNLFRYVENNGLVYGRVEFPNDFSGYYELTVNMSVATILRENQNIRLELQTAADQLVAGNPAVYNIYFPIQNVIPKPTSITFNGRMYCSGPPEQAFPGRGVTNMWAATYFQVSSGPRPFRPNTGFQPGVQHTVKPINTLPPPMFVNTRDQTTVSPTTITSSKPTGSFFLTFGAVPPITGNTFSSSGNSLSNGFLSFGAPFLNNLFISSLKEPKTPTITTSLIYNVTVSGNNIQCGGIGLNAQTLVVNGESVEEGEFPWMVAIMYRQNLDYKYGCTGTLITDRHVITAAHCVRFFNAPIVPTEDLLAVLGKISIRNWANNGVIRDIDKVTSHKDYKQNKGDADIAVLKLKTIVEFTNLIQPACLWQDDDDLDKIVGKMGTVAGWGKDEFGNNFVVDAKKVSLPIVSQVTCLRSDPDFADITSPRTFCAGKLDGSGPCTGDSGAGLVIRKNGKWTLRGLVAVSLKETGSCALTKYSVFVDVAKFRNWIDQTLV